MRSSNLALSRATMREYTLPPVIRILSSRALGAALLLFGVSGVCDPLEYGVLSAQEAPVRPDLLTFAQGAIPLSIGAAGVDHGASFEHAVKLIDGDAGGFSMLSRATEDTDVSFVYELPASTTFDRFAIPNVLETPSPSQTFFRTVRILGSAVGPDGPFEPLAAGELTTHEGSGQVTELDIIGGTPVQWVRVELQGGIEMLREQMFLEFSEVIGNGIQETPELSDAFTGAWRDRGVRLELRQSGPTVVGCYDQGAPLDGTVTGNILKARGVDPSDGVVSLFILAVADDGSVRGVRSDNGAPFRLFNGAQGEQGAVVDCAELTPPVLGCGAVIHGINFDFDSASIRPESEGILEELFKGLSSDTDSSIVIEGHTSSEGSEAYNLDLSERRAQAVAEDLVRRGLNEARVTGVGRGEAVPIAPNSDESGRSLNRRVEVRCTQDA